MDFEIVDLTDPAGQLRHPELLAAGEPVHRELRPQLPADYLARMRQIFAGGGRMAAARERDGRIVGLAVWRFIDNTFEGRTLYVDDLVVSASARSGGVGHALLSHCEALARQGGATALDLDSGTQRHDAHRFYFRERMSIVSYHFRKALV